jgi:hypothetical protein
MSRFIFGGTANYGQVAGILMLDSTIPRTPGDPGHAQTFDFPVRYGVIRDFPFEDLITFRSDIQREFNVPVFDLVSLMEFFADGYRFRNFTSRYL